MRLLGAVAEPHGPVGCVLQVVARLLQTLACDRPELRVGRPGQRRPKRSLERREQEVAQDRPSEVAVRQLDDREVAELGLVAQERELVLVAPPAFQSAGMREQQARLADQVQRDVRQRDVLLDHGPVAAPLGEPLPEDERRIRDAHHVLDVRVAGGSQRHRHRCLTCG
jgi:hypothetical protein